MYVSMSYQLAQTYYQYFLYLLEYTFSLPTSEIHSVTLLKAFSEWDSWKRKQVVVFSKTFSILLNTTPLWFCCGMSHALFVCKSGLVRFQCFMSMGCNFYSLALLRQCVWPSVGGVLPEYAPAAEITLQSHVLRGWAGVACHCSPQRRGHSGSPSLLDWTAPVGLLSHFAACDSANPFTLPSLCLHNPMFFPHRHKNNCSCRILWYIARGRR